MGAMLIETSLVMVTVADAVAPASDCAVAEIVTLAGDGKICGAVYSPLALIRPSCAFPPAIPFRLQLTAVSLLPLTVALKLTESPSRTEVLDGVMAIEIFVWPEPPLTDPQPASASGSKSAHPRDD